MSKLSAKFDPTGHYASQSEHDEGELKQRLFEACGLIPSFYYEIMHDIVPHETSVEGIMDLLMKVYGFGTDVRMKGKVDSEGVYSFPEDPDLHPYLVIKGFGHQVYIYPYGIVAVVDKDEQSIARMD
jgi:hypothetical protein